MVASCSPGYAPGERAAPEHPTGSQNTLFAPNSLLIKVGPQFRNAPERQISGEDQPDRLSLGLIHDQLSVMHVIAERDGPTHPHAFATRGCIGAIGLQGPFLVSRFSEPVRPKFLSGIRTQRVGRPNREVCFLAAA